MLEDKEWPDFYPEDMELPPKDSESAEGEVFRLVDNCPPEKSDFRTSHEDSPNRYKKHKNEPKVLEMLYGTSFWLEEDTAREKLTLPPVRRKYSKVAKGILQPDDGMMRVENKHVSVWFHKSASPQKYFSCLRGGDNASE